MPTGRMDNASSLEEWGIGAYSISYGLNTTCSTRVWYDYLLFDFSGRRGGHRSRWKSQHLLVECGESW